jgi:hypothetical protein
MILWVLQNKILRLAICLGEIFGLHPHAPYICTVDNAKKHNHTRRVAENA